MLNYLWAYILTLPVLAALDLTWVGVLMRGFYKERLSHLIIPDGFVWQPAVAWYLLYVFSLFYFVIAQAKDVTAAALSGALLGLLAYGTYDLVNMATLPQWPLSVTVVDIAWGMVLSATVSAAGFCIYTWLVS